MKTEELNKIVVSVLDGLGLDLVDLEVLGSGGRTTLRLYVDEEGGVNLKRCTEASRAVSDQLDRKNLIAGRYTLQVSSPGIDRPLRTERDFLRNVGRKVNITIMENGIHKTIDGKIASADRGHVILETTGEILEITLEDIVLAKVTVEF